ncbi:MAG: hypothetical protein JO006_15850 [Paucibacter sp.]|nr:hypothetical protein [Roseateles sp.]
MVEKLFAALGLVICIALAVHMVLPLRLRARLLVWWRDPLGRKARAHARAATEAAIKRAQRPGRGRWQGNVYRLGEKGDRGDGDGNDGDGENGQDRRTLH